MKFYPFLDPSDVVHLVNPAFNREKGPKNTKYTLCYKRGRDGGIFGIYTDDENRAPTCIRCIAGAHLDATR